MNKFFAVSVFTLALTSVQVLTAQSTLAATLLKSFTSYLSGDQEVKTNPDGTFTIIDTNSPAVGTSTLQLFETSPGNFLLTYDITVDGLDFAPMASAIAGNPVGRALVDREVYKFHIHQGTRDVNGSLPFPLTEISLSDGSLGANQDDEVQFINQGNNVWRITGDLDSSEGFTPDFANLFLNTPNGQDTPFYYNIHTFLNQGGEIRGQIVAAVPESSNLLGLAGVGSLSLLALRRKKN